MHYPGCTCPYCMKAQEMLGVGLAPIVRRTGDETVFGGAGNSHFSFVEKQGFHVTTDIPGFGKKEGLDKGLSTHDYLKHLK